MQNNIARKLFHYFYLSFPAEFEYFISALCSNNTLAMLKGFILVFIDTNTEITCNSVDKI